MSDSCEKHKIHPSAIQESENGSCSRSSKFHENHIGMKVLHPRNGCRELNNSQKMVSKNRHEGKRSGLSGRSYKALLRLQSERAKTSADQLPEEKDKQLIGDCSAQVDSSNKLPGEKDKQLIGDCSVQADSSNNVGEANTEKSNSPCKAHGEFPRKELEPVTESQDVCGAILVVNEKENLDGLNLNSTSDKDHLSHINDYRLDKNIDSEQRKCVICCLEGKLLCCAGQGCSRSYHLSCVNPPFTFDQLGVWHCVWCVKKKVQMDVYSVSEGIESVLDAMKMADDDAKQKQYLVKYKGIAHVHNRWISEEDLKLQAPLLVVKFKKRSQESVWKKDWSVPQCVLAKRLLLFPDESSNTFQKLDDCHHEWLVKWKGLDYTHATWELENAPFLRTPESLMLIDDFENRHQKEKDESDYHEIDKDWRIQFAQLEDLPGGCPDHLVHVNKLLECWKRDQNALVIDEQDRFVKIVLFLLSLLKEMRGPFLILTTSTALSLWEDEFQQRAPHANVIVYKGSKDIRSSIRSLELFNESRGIMFHILLAQHRAFDEDRDHFKHIKWEVVLIDECQRPSMLAHSEMIIMLASNMRLLLASSEIKDWSFNYHSALSLLDSQYSGATKDILEVNPIVDKLKERMVHFTAYECKPERMNFAEFWVPVMLTGVQIEQYCASLYSKSFLLCSCSKRDSPVSLHDLLISARKTCDHPFIANWSLRSSVLQGVPEADHFDVEIQLSGKLQLLNKFLSEIERQGLRVLVYFQSMGSPGVISIGDILDDFIHQKFGRDSYARIDGYMSPAKKKAAIDMFNCKEKGAFVCLIDARACLPSTKLVSVDAIIVYNSDWDPLNDLRALQKITIHSQIGQLKVFRLYSSCTVEEKLLILAKEGMTVDSNIKNIKKATCHKLLTWGASLLFSKFDASSEHCADASNSKNCSDQTFLEDVFQEMLLLLPCISSEKHDGTSCSTAKNHPGNVLEVQQNEGSYLCRSSLSGEVIADSADNFSIIRNLMDSEPPTLFWTNLLEWRQPRWRYMSNRSQRNKRKVHYIKGLPEGREKKKSDTAKGSIEASSTVSHMLKLKPGWKSKSEPLIQDMRISQNAATKRYRSVHNLVNDNPVGRKKKKTKTQEHNGWDAHQAVSPLTMATNNNLSGGQVGSPAASGSLAYELPLSADLASPVDGAVDELASGGIHHQNGSFVGGSGHEPQVSIRAYQSAISEPLDAQIQKMMEAKEEAIKFHENMKLQIDSERRKELEEVNKKFDLLSEKADLALANTTVHLEACCNTLNEQKLLAVAMLQKHGYASAKWSGQQRDAISAYITEICGLFSSTNHEKTIEDTASPEDSDPSTVVQTAEKDSSTSEPNAMGPGESVPTLENLASHARIPPPSTEVLKARSGVTAAQSMTSPVPMHLPIITTNQPGQLLVPSINVSRSYAKQGRAIRAPAPHLRSNTPVSSKFNIQKMAYSGFSRHSPELSDVEMNT